MCSPKNVWKWYDLTNIFQMGWKTSNYRVYHIYIYTYNNTYFDRYTTISDISCIPYVTSHPYKTIYIYMVYLSTPTNCRCNASTLLICHESGPPSIVPGLAAAGEIPTSFREAAACRCQQAACCQQHRGKRMSFWNGEHTGGGGGWGFMVK